MRRDFTETSENELVECINRIGSGSDQAFTGQISCVRNGYAYWIGTLGIDVYFENMTAFNNSVLEKCEISEAAVNVIFTSARDLDKTYAGLLGDVLVQLGNWKKYIGILSGYVNGPAGVFTVGNISSGLKEIAAAIQEQEVKCAAGRMSYETGGISVYNTEMIDLMLKKASSEITVEQKLAVIRIITDLAEKHAVNTEVLTGDLQPYLGFDKIILEQVYCDNVYITVLNQLLKNGRDKASFASELMSFESSGADMQMLGASVYGELNKLADLIPIGSSAGLQAFLLKLTSEHTEIFAGKLDNNIEAGINIKSDFGSSTMIPGAVVNGETSISALQASWADETDDMKGNVSAKVGNAYADAQVSAGLFLYEDGKVWASPSVSAELGAGISAVDLSAYGSLGNDNIGLYGSADVDVLEAEAKAGAGAAMFDGEGNFNPQAYFNVSAQANLVDVTGAAGLMILGADVGIKAGVNVGVGAHAEGGYEDGHLKMDVGAALGVGVHFGFDIDLDGLVKGVSAVIGDAWNSLLSAVSDEWSNICNYWEHFWNPGSVEYS